MLVLLVAPLLVLAAHLREASQSCTWLKSVKALFIVALEGPDLPRPAIAISS